MEDSVIQKLLVINKEFYQTFASDFSETRLRPQPGMKKILRGLPSQAKVLDLGCGNGELPIWLAGNGHTGIYLGVDMSSDLLEIARNRLNDHIDTNLQDNKNGVPILRDNFHFLRADISEQSWDDSVRKVLEIGTRDVFFDYVFAFATFHHLPAKKLHIRILQKIHSLLKGNGHLFLSNWQFLNSERLRQRIQPWETINLDQDDVEPGDYLLDWRRGGYGVRYVHHFSEDELFGLASITNFKVARSFYSDGKEGNLGLYQEWVKRKEMNMLSSPNKETQNKPN